MPSIPPDRTPPDLDTLLAQAHWMRSLARSLVSGSAAEDVVQDAWLVALENRSSVHGDVRGWLRTIVRRLAQRRRARESRRASVEARAARPEAAGEVRTAVERMELQQWLAETLLALDEPYRSAVILRHLEGLDPGRIAEKQGCSPAAARQRVSRGLARLRAMLDEKHGDRRAWGVLLEPWLQPMPVSPGVPPPCVQAQGAPWVQGGILMSSKLVLGSVAALVAVSLVWWVNRIEAPTERGREPIASVYTDSLRPASILASEDDSMAHAPVREAAAVPATERIEPTPETALDPRFAGRVVDAERAPIVGAEVVLRRPELGHFNVLDLEVAKHPEEVARARSDEDGRFSFDVEPGIPFDLEVSAAGFCGARLLRRSASESTEVVLTPGFLVHGKVQRARDGAPISEASVRVFQMGKANSERVTTTDARGDYALRFPFEEDAVLEVLPQREMGSSWLRITPGPDGTLRRDLALEDGIEVRGQVVDADSGKPIEKARIGEGWTFRRSATTDAEGRYRLLGFGVEGGQELYVQAHGYGKAQRVDLPPAAEGVMTLDFALVRGRVVRGQVLDRDGYPVAKAYVAAVGARSSKGISSHDWLSARSDATGRFQIEGLIPDLRHCLITSARGYATRILDLPPEELSRPELDVGGIWLSPPGLVAGVVVDDDGRPQAGVTVQLSGSDRERGRLRPDSGLAPEAGWYVEGHSTTTDAGGRFAFGALAAGEYVVNALRAGRPPSRELTVVLEDGARREDLVLTLARGESITGQVLDEEDRPVEGVYVGARFRRSRRPGANSQPRSQLSARTGPDGVFAFTDLTPGAYDLSFHPFETSETGDTPWLETTREAVETGRDPLRVTPPRGQRVAGRLRDAKGAALVGYQIVGVCSTSERSPSASADEDGSFALTVEPGTMWNLEVRGPWQAETSETVFHTEYAIAAGTRELEVVVDLTAAAR